LVSIRNISSNTREVAANAGGFQLDRRHFGTRNRDPQAKYRYPEAADHGPEVPDRHPVATERNPEAA
jgi:hypothetical protein